MENIGEVEGEGEGEGGEVRSEGFEDHVIEDLIRGHGKVFDRWDERGGLLGFEGFLG